MNYFIQIAIVPISLTKNETEGISLITQYNLHGLFIALEELGYLMMSTSFLFIAPIFNRKTRLEFFIRWIFVVSFVAIILSLVMISMQYGIDRKDREVISLSISWLVLIINGILISIFFKKRLNKSKNTSLKRKIKDSKEKIKN